MAARGDWESLTSKTSSATILVAVIGLVLAAAFDSLATVTFGGPKLALAISLWGDAAMGLLATLVIFYATRRLHSGLDRNTWTLIGAGVLAGTIANGFWALWQSSHGLPGLGLNPACALYLVSYVLWAVAMVRWVLAHRSDIDFFRVVAESTSGAFILGGLAWFAVLSPALRSAATTTTVTTSDAVGALMDFALLVVPLIALILTYIRIGDARLAMPWLPFSVAVGLVVLADLGWFWERSQGIVVPGSLTDFAYAASNVLIAASAFAAIDMQRAMEKDERASAGDQEPSPGN